VQDDMPPAKRGNKGRASSFTQDQKSWIEAKMQPWGSIVPPLLIMKDWLEEGQASNILPMSATHEQLRHVCRKCAEK